MPDRYPLEGIRVLDLTQYVSGPYCTQVLADLGATVLKVERPGKGDVYRGQGPVFLNGESVSFLTLNRGKRSVALDLRAEADRARLLELAGQADVLVENMKPGTLARYGLDYASLAEAHPRLVYCSISGFGQQGPLAARGAYDLTIQALSGVMAITGHPGAPPAKVPVAALDFGSALYGVIGVLAALRDRDRTGRGQWVQTSLMETGLAWLSMHIATYLAGGEPPEPMGTRSPFFAPYEAYATADGHLVVVGTGGASGWSSFCAALGLERLEHDPRFAENSDRVANAELLREEVEAVMRRQPTAHWEARLAEAGVPHAPVQRLDEVLASDQVDALGSVTTLDHPVAGEVPIVRLPVTFSAAASTAGDPPPPLDAHAEVLFDPAGNGRP
jgi:formyl-CoA transferase/CoA:oxalate CoA-transferase